MNISTLHLEKMNTEDIPEWGTEEFKVWWESQYDYAESHYIQKYYTSDLEWADGFVGK